MYEYDEDPVLYIHPPTTQTEGKDQPAILTTRFDKLMYTAPGFLRFLAIIDVPEEVCAYKIAQIVSMPENLIIDSNGKDVTWLALKLFLLWLHGADSRPVTTVDGQQLSLQYLLEFGSIVKAERYIKRVQQAIDLVQGKEAVDTNKGGLNVKENQGLAKKDETEVGKFCAIPIPEEEANKFQYLDHPESKDNSDWSTKL